MVITCFNIPVKMWQNNTMQGQCVANFHTIQKTGWGMIKVMEELLEAI